MKTILKLLAGGGGGWIFAGIIAAAVIVGAGGGFYARGVYADRDISREQLKTEKASGETKQCKLEHETARANGAELVITTLRGSILELEAVSNELARKEDARKTDLRSFIERLSHVEDSKACGASGPEREYRLSVQPRRPAVAPAP